MRRPGSRRAQLEARRAAGAVRSYAWRDGRVVKAKPSASRAAPRRPRAGRRHRAACVGCGVEIVGYNPGSVDTAAWCRDCAAQAWRVVWSRESGEPLPERLQSLVVRENTVE